MKRILRLLTLATVAAAAAAAVRALRRQSDPLPTIAPTPSAPWPPLQPVTTTAEPAGETETASETETETDAPRWVEPAADGSCPDGYPIKAKSSSGIFHAPGQMNYDRTAPDRCYVDAEAAEADGLRAAKR